MKLLSELGLGQMKMSYPHTMKGLNGHSSDHNVDYYSKLTKKQVSGIIDDKSVIKTTGPVLGVAAIQHLPDGPHAFWLQPRGISVCGSVIVWAGTSWPEPQQQSQDIRFWSTDPGWPFTSCDNITSRHGSFSLAQYFTHNWHNI